MKLPNFLACVIPKSIKVLKLTNWKLSLMIMFSIHLKLKYNGIKLNIMNQPIKCIFESFSPRAYYYATRNMNCILSRCSVIHIIKCCERHNEKWYPNIHWGIFTAIVLIYNDNLLKTMILTHYVLKDKKPRYKNFGRTAHWR